MITGPTFTSKTVGAWLVCKLIVERQTLITSAALCVVSTYTLVGHLIGVRGRRLQGTAGGMAVTLTLGQHINVPHCIVVLCRRKNFVESIQYYGTLWYL